MKRHICTTIKHGWPHLEHWIRWYLAFGFDRIFLHEDFGSASHAGIVDRFSVRFARSALGEFVGKHLEGDPCRQVPLFDGFLTRAAESHGRCWRRHDAIDHPPPLAAAACAASGPWLH